jgi:hypothetical protein
MFLTKLVENNKNFSDKRVDKNEIFTDKLAENYKYFPDKRIEK